MYFYPGGGKMTMYVLTKVSREGTADSESEPWIRIN